MQVTLIQKESTAAYEYTAATATNGKPHIRNFYKKE